jgi:type III secretory pathway lipoprotein EscJ
MRIASLAGVVARLVAVAIFVGLGCAPTVDGPVERQRVADRDDSLALSAQLATLPGAVSATATIHRPATDPLGTSATSKASGASGASGASAASAAVLVVVDDATDRVATSQAASMLVHASAPEVGAPAIVVLVGAHRAELANVGPFVVEKSSAAALKAVLAIALVVILGLAAWIALRERRRA